MAESMRVDPFGLRNAEPAFGALASSVEEILVRLAGSLDSEGQCWGCDRTGDAFAAAYLPAAERTREALPGLRDGVLGVGEALVTVADSVDAAESRARSRFS